MILWDVMQGICTVLTKVVIAFTAYQKQKLYNFLQKLGLSERFEWGKKRLNRLFKKKNCSSFSVITNMTSEMFTELYILTLHHK